MGFGVQGVSMSGRAGAESTQARAPTCTSPSPLALHPRLNLYGLRVLNSDRAFVVFIVFYWLSLEARHDADQLP